MQTEFGIYKQGFWLSNIHKCGSLKVTSDRSKAKKWKNIRTANNFLFEQKNVLTGYVVREVS